MNIVDSDTISWYYDTDEQNISPRCNNCSSIMTQLTASQVALRLIWALCKPFAHKVNHLLTAFEFLQQ